MIKIILSVVLALVTYNSVVFAENLKVGAILPLSGEPAAVGENCRKGVELARREQLQKGASITVYFEDTPGALARNTLSAFNKLKNIEKVENFLGFLWSEELGAIGPIADKADLALIGFSNPTVKPKNVILIWPAEAREAKYLAQDVIKKYKHVAILSETTIWSQNFAEAYTEEFSKLGGTVVETIELASDTKDVAASVLRLKRHTVEALIIPPYSLFPLYSKAIKTLGINLPMYSAELDQTAIDKAAGSAEGVIVVGPKDPSTEFIQSYHSEFGSYPDIPAGNCYDGLNLFALAAMKTGQRDGKSIITFLKTLQNYDGALGHYTFENGETIIDLGYKVVKDGKLSN